MAGSEPLVFRSCLYCKERVPPDAYFCCYCGARLPYIPKPEEKPIIKSANTSPENNSPKKQSVVYTVKELAEYLKTSTYSIYSLAKSNQLEHVRIGSRVLFHRDKVDEWLKNGGTQKIDYGRRK